MGAATGGSLTSIPVADALAGIAVDALDPLFGNGGRVSFTDLPNNRLRGSALARAANGALIVAGIVDGASEIFVARIIP